MTEAEQIDYLANLFFVARLDGRVDSGEDALAETMAKGIGAGYLETRKAVDLSATSDYAIRISKRFSERVRNLEDMIHMAYHSDGLDADEKKTIIEFARNIGVTQTQLELVRKEAKKRLQEK